MLSTVRNYCPDYMQKHYRYGVLCIPKKHTLPDGFGPIPEWGMLEYQETKLPRSESLWKRAAQGAMKVLQARSALVRIRKIRDELTLFQDEFDLADTGLFGHA